LLISDNTTIPFDDFNDKLSYFTETVQNLTQKQTSWHKENVNRWIYNKHDQVNYPPLI
jgi:hypothetical protein